MKIKNFSIAFDEKRATAKQDTDKQSSIKYEEAQLYFKLRPTFKPIKLQR